MVRLVNVPACRSALQPSMYQQFFKMTMAHSMVLHVRVDDEIKEQASEVLAARRLALALKLAGTWSP